MFVRAYPRLMGYLFLLGCVVALLYWLRDQSSTIQIIVTILLTGVGLGYLVDEGVKRIITRLDAIEENRNRPGWLAWFC